MDWLNKSCMLIGCPFLDEDLLDGEDGKGMCEGAYLQMFQTV